MKSLLLSLVLSLGLGIGVGVANAQEGVQAAQASTDQPAVQYMMVDPGGH
ncbi:hypothetical protein [Bacillus thuringiensis]|nr:hypothetical protein [Bacillus thuringiensis]HDR5271825.1 hypothetical protein [Bacillus thuringiensis]